MKLLKLILAGFQSLGVARSAGILVRQGDSKGAIDLMAKSS